MTQSVEQLAQTVYGPDVKVHTRNLGPNVVQVAVLHDEAGPLVLATGHNEQQASEAVAAALGSLKGV